MLWQRTNAQGLITKLLKVIRIVNALNLRKFNNPTSRFELNPSSANPTKWPNTLQQFVGKLPKNCLSVFGHFVGLALKGLKNQVPLPFFTISSLCLHYFLFALLTLSNYQRSKKQNKIFKMTVFQKRKLLNQFQKWRATRAGMDSVGSVLTWAVCQLVQCGLRGYSLKQK